MDLEGNEEALTLTPRDIEAVRWSPDGRSIVYESLAEGDRDSDIYTYDVELGTTPRQLTFEGQNRSPMFSPDGNRLVFSSQREGTDSEDLYVKRLDDDSPAELLITLPGAQRPSQWPSDTLIVFMMGPAPPRSVDAGSIRPGEPEGGGELPFWSPDGNTVYYWRTGGPDEVFMAARLRRDPTPAVLRTDSLFTGRYQEADADLHPDGDRLVIPVLQAVGATALEGTAAEPERFLVVTNWFEELLARVGN